MTLHGFKSILVGLAPDPEMAPSPALQLGLSLARTAGAHLTVEALSLTLRPMPSPVSHWPSDLVADENHRLQSLAESRANEARQGAATAVVESAVHVRHLPFADLMSRFAAMARVHDVTLLDRVDDEDMVVGGLVNEALFASGRPLILVPPTSDGTAPKRILVAWDGSAQAARAVNDALPLLRAAEAVELVSVCNENELSFDNNGPALVQHLTRHRVSASLETRVTGDGDVSSALRKEARVFGAELIVMGAFGHSRLREFVLGGVTRSLTHDSPVPLFLSH